MSNHPDGRAPTYGAAAPITPGSPFETDIAAQPAALRALANSDTLTSLPTIDLATFDRIILTGMGASHYSALPAWRRLVAMGCPAWWLSTSELLDSPQLLTRRSLLWVTSQSGRSGEIVALLDGLGAGLARPGLIVGVTNDAGSLLANSSDVLLDIRAGEESTVSTKSYLNSLAANHLLLTHMTSSGTDTALKAVLTAADETEVASVSLSPVKAIASRILQPDSPRLALIGAADQAASALVGALVIKEAAKLPAEGFVGGEFRHGPLELAGAGLTALVFTGPAASPGLSQLIRDLRETGSSAVEIGRSPGTGGERISTPATSELSQTMADAKVAQLLSVELARARALVPGEFRFGQKVTSLA